MRQALRALLCPIIGHHWRLDPIRARVNCARCPADYMAWWLR